MGVDGDKEGWESGYSVYKCIEAEAPAEALADAQGWERGGHSVYKCQPGAAQASGVNRAVEYDESDGEEEEEDADETNYTMTPNVATRSSVRQQTQKAQKEISPKPTVTCSSARHSPAIPLVDLQLHLLNNQICLFYSSTSGKAPRTWLFNSCDTVQKLCAEAVAGDVFPDTQANSGCRVLSIRLGGLPNKKMVVGEDENDDFTEMLYKLTTTRWFARTDGEIIDSGTVEIRAMM